MTSSRRSSPPSAATLLDSASSAPLSILPPALRLPANRDRLKAILEREIARAEAIEQAHEAEERFKREQGEAASFETEKARCADGAEGVIHWLEQWAWTFDPRLVGKKDAAGNAIRPYLPFKLWPRQKEFVRWFMAKLERGEEGLTEKSRDVGVSYLVTLICLNRWLFVEGFKATFGSREAELVDSKDDPDSLFQKMRITLYRLPSWQLPKGFETRKHDNVMQLTNPENGATITGEAGDQMGRGGRSTVYVIDEAAFVPHADTVHRAVAGSTDCIQWVSSVNGMGNLFYKRRMALPKEQVFVFDYHDDPRKTAAWIAAKKASMEAADWASEYERDYGASVEGVCIPGTWVQSAQQLAKLVPELTRGAARSGGDVGGGKAESVVIHRFGPIVLPPAVSKNPDTTDTADWMIAQCEAAGSKVLNFDPVGIGAGVLSTLTKKKTAVQRNAVNVGDTPTDRVWDYGHDDQGNEEIRTSKDIFGNLKAELWWCSRQAFQRTHQHVLWITTKGKEGVKHPLSELVSLPDPVDTTLSSQLSSVRYFKNEKGKIVIETKEQLRKRQIASPDRADAFVLTFYEPVDDIPDIRLDSHTFHRPNPAKIG